MRRALLALALTAVAFASTAVVAHADYLYGYTGAGAWFSPGTGTGSPYDNACGRWSDNDFSKASGAWGLVTFIAPDGGWSNTRQGYGLISTQPSNIFATKKMHCKNNSGVGYQGGCFGFYRKYSCV